MGQKEEGILPEMYLIHYPDYVAYWGLALGVSIYRRFRNSVILLILFASGEREHESHLLIGKVTFCIED